VTTNGNDVAVKIFKDRTSDLDDRQFRNEFYNLTKVKHKNIVRVLGYCYETKQTRIEYDGKTVLAEETQKALCFEFLGNGTLENHLFGMLLFHFQCHRIKCSCIYLYLVDG